jgi:hypothetical protein
MIFNEPQSLMRIITQPADSPHRQPKEMAGWWMSGREERPQAVESAKLESDTRAARISRPRWPKSRTAGHAPCADPRQSSTVAV